MYNLCPTTLQLLLFLILRAVDDETDRPDLMECIRFRGRVKRINIPQEIGVKYHQFGPFLLDDSNGARTRNIAYKNREDSELVNIEILKEWITGRGKHPVTWKTLTEVLRDIELSTLAGEIEAVKCDSKECEAVKNIESSKHYNIEYCLYISSCVLIVEHFDVTDDDMMFDLRTGMHTSESIFAAM